MACPHVRFHLKTTVSILNAFHLPDLLKMIIESELAEPHLWFANLVSNPPYYNIQALPKDYKLRLEESYLNFIDTYLLPKLGKKRSTNIERQLKKVLSFSKIADRLGLQKFFEVTKKLDQMRNENFLLQCPEYRDLLPPNQVLNQKAQGKSQKSSLSV